MTDPTPGPTPPPERPLTDRARARIRGELLQYAGNDRSTAPRWLVPAGAAAAVALVAGMAFWAVNAGGSDGEGLPVAGGGTSSAPATASTPGTAPGTEQATPSNVPETAYTTKPPESTMQVGTGSCEDELVNVLPGARLAVQLDDSSSFYVKGDQFVLCDKLGGRTTIHQPQPLVPGSVDISAFFVSSLHDHGQIIRVGGGVVPDGSSGFDVAYTFPDGHTEHATTATDDEGRTWWYLAYAYPDPGGNELRQPPIKVTVQPENGTFTLQYGPPDTCAQANHGC